MINTICALFGWNLDTQEPVPAPVTRRETITLWRVEVFSTVAASILATIYYDAYPGYLTGLPNQTPSTLWINELADIPPGGRQRKGHMTFNSANMDYILQECTWYRTVNDSGPTAAEGN
jgi:hypothetical protein